MLRHRRHGLTPPDPQNVHTIGDRAAKITLDAIETVLAGRHGKGLFRLAHAQILTPSDLVRAAKMGGEFAMLAPRE